MNMILRLRSGYAVTGILLALFSSACQADDDWGRLDVARATDQKYLEECGACHFAYQPGLLPARSWDKLMGGLADHFGENAELAAESVAYLRAYLTQNAADNAPYKRSQGMMRSLKAEETPLRISETRYFLGKHHELPQGLVQDNPEVQSFSRCDACHTRAGEGSYNEHQVRIPGYGQWDD